jgi:outer membrane protein OmpA-like peptidoglycan-associated protein
MAAALAAGTLVPAAGRAQPNPSADQIIKSLTPGESLGTTTRGIRIGPGQAPAHQATPAASAEHGPSVSLNVRFATGSADLTPEAQRALDELGRALSAQQLASYRFRIEGHTDTVGDREMNQMLSERRAATVVDYLESRYRIDRSRLQAVGMGEEGLLVPTPDQTAEPRNRRVEVVNIGS